MLQVSLLAGVALAGAAMTDRIPVLMYHHLVEHTPRASSELHVDCFAAQMAFLAAHGYRPLTLDEFSDYQAAGAFPERSLLITFDDGYRSFREHAFPVLQRHGFPAVVFPLVATRPGLQRVVLFSDQLSFHDLRAMAADGGLIEVGSHSYDLHHYGEHGVPAALRQPGETTSDHLERVRADLVLSRMLLEQQTDQAITALAWPFGVSSEAVATVAEGVGFELQFTTDEGYVTADSSRDALPRFNVAALEGHCFTRVVTRALP
ncbi:MAG: hypothetical protein EA416_07060 [Trueperaceae bacterium]|nr:MAG: hypothetical protein EA416_07060 [Trueperaceae bacterium]